MAGVTLDVAFFLAPDDETAARTRPRGPGPEFTKLTCHRFYPDDAVAEWEAYFEGSPAGSPPPLDRLASEDHPRYVAPVVNDGTGVFAVPGGLTRALAGAGPAELGELAGRWAEGLRRAGEDTPDEEPLDILEGVARLAAAVVETGGGLYCWHY